MLATILNSHLGYDSMCGKLFDGLTKISDLLYRRCQVREEGAQGGHYAEGGDCCAWVFDTGGVRPEGPAGADALPRRGIKKLLAPCQIMLVCPAADGV